MTPLQTLEMGLDCLQNEAHDVYHNIHVLINMPVDIEEDGWTSIQRYAERLDELAAGIVQRKRAIASMKSLAKQTPSDPMHY